MKTLHQKICFVLCLLGLASAVAAQELPRFTQIQRQTNGDVSLQFAAPAGSSYRVDASPDFTLWSPLATLLSAGTNSHTDSAAPYLNARFYRALPVSEVSPFTGDHLSTADGDVIIRPVNHASFVMSWKGKTIYNDPVGGAAPYRGLPLADLILVSHMHGDHFNAATLDAVKGPNAIIIAPAAVYSSLSAALKNLAIPLANGASTNVMGLTVDAVPAYNANHPKGVGNGYVLTIGGKRLYMSGDTEDVAEMRALKDIDVAFLCMNVPFTMPVNRAASAVRDFKPKVVYPYHYRNQDSTFANLNTFRQQVGADFNIEVRVRKWY